MYQQYCVLLDTAGIFYSHNPACPTIVLGSTQPLTVMSSRIIFWEIAGSIPNRILGIFYWHNPSGNTITMEWTQPLTEIIKGKEKVNFTLEQAAKTQRGSRDIALLFP